MRNNTSTSDDMRWEVMKSMLDDFPQLQDRVKQYILEKKAAQPNPTIGTDQSVKELLQNAVRAYRQER